MSDPNESTTDESKRGAPTPSWYFQPRFILPTLVALVLVSAILTPAPVSGRDGDARLSTTSTAPQGAQMFYELAERLKWNVRRETRNSVPQNASTVLAVLDPTVELRDMEVHNMLQHVRDGGALLVVLGNGTEALSDSLHVTVDSVGATKYRRSGTQRSCKDDSQFLVQGLWLGDARLFGLKVPATIAMKAQTFVTVRKVDAATDSLGRERTDFFGSRPSVIGFPFGAGRIVVASDADVFRNDAIRVCQYELDIAAVRELSFLKEGGVVARDSIVFDEFHQSRGISTGTIALISNYFTTTQSGHAVFQLCGAGLLLLLAGATRVQPPREEARLVRRSPLEHVDALARAYAQVGATRTAVMRLVRGLRRRVERGGARSAATERDESFLSRIAETKPSLASDIDLVRKALTSNSSQSEFKEVGNAIGRIEASITQP